MHVPGDTVVVSVPNIKGGTEDWGYKIQVFAATGSPALSLDPASERFRMLLTCLCKTAAALVQGPKISVDERKGIKLLTAKLLVGGAVASSVENLVPRDWMPLVESLGLESAIEASTPTAAGAESQHQSFLYQLYSPERNSPAMALVYALFFGAGGPIQQRMRLFRGQAKSIMSATFAAILHHSSETLVDAAIVAGDAAFPVLEESIGAKAVNRAAIEAAREAVGPELWEELRQAWGPCEEMRVWAASLKSAGGKERLAKALQRVLDKSKFLLSLASSSQALTSSERSRRGRHAAPRRSPALSGNPRASEEANEQSAALLVAWNARRSKLRRQNSQDTIERVTGHSIDDNSRPPIRH